MCQAVILCLHLHDTSLDLRHYEVLYAPDFSCMLNKTDEHLIRMNGYDSRVQGVESRIRPGVFFKQTPYHV